MINRNMGNALSGHSMHARIGTLCPMSLTALTGPNAVTISTQPVQLALSDRVGPSPRQSIAGQQPSFASRDVTMLANITIERPRADLPSARLAKP